MPGASVAGVVDAGLDQQSRQKMSPLGPASLIPATNHGVASFGIGGLTAWAAELDDPWAWVQTWA